MAHFGVKAVFGRDFRLSGLTQLIQSNPLDVDTVHKEPELCNCTGPYISLYWTDSEMFKFSNGAGPA